jgi:hypothetical protein
VGLYSCDTCINANIASRLARIGEHFHFWGIHKLVIVIITATDFGKAGLN